MRVWILALAALAGFGGTAQAQSIAIGAQVGTSGIGGELQYNLLPGIVARGAVDFLSYSRDASYEQVDYTGRLKFATAGAFVDWHPFLGSFLLSGGMYFGKRQVSLAATPGTSITIDNVLYTPAQAGTVNGSIKMSSAQPFLGLGFDNSFVGLPGLGFKLLAGVAFSGAPSVALDSTGGTLTNNAVFQSHLANERAKIRDDASEFRYFPVINAGLTFSF